MSAHFETNEKLSSLFSLVLWSNGKGVVIPEDDEHDVVDREGGDDAGGDLNDARHQDTRPEHPHLSHSNSRKPS